MLAGTGKIRYRFAFGGDNPAQVKPTRNSNGRSLCRRFALVLIAMMATLGIGRAGEPPRAPKIDRDLLIAEDRAPIRDADQNQYEFRAYTYLLIQAHRTSTQAFANSVRRDLTYAHLLEQPSTYRGEVVHLEGRLKRLRRFDAPTAARQEGILEIYEGWVFDDLYFTNPYCVLCTDTPSDIAVGERIEERVQFDGYFFKRYRYKDGEGRYRDCPLLIGHTLVKRPVAAAAPESVWSFSKAFLPMFLGFITAAALLTAGLAWWFRRGDDAVHARLQAAREVPTFEPEIGKEPENPWTS